MAAAPRADIEAQSIDLDDSDNTPVSLTPGYPALANKISHYPQLGIFRGFRSLTARNLLYYQAELKYLEHELVELEAQDSKDEHRENFRYAGNWLSLSSARPPNNLQWQKFMNIREKLKEYHDAIIQASTIASMEEPADYDLDYLQHYNQTWDMGPGALHGRDSSIWGSLKHPDHYAPDLLTIKPQAKEDAFSNWFISRGMNIFFRCWRHFPRRPSRVTGEVNYKRTSLLRITHFLTCIVATTPPLLAVVVLSYVTSFRVKMGIMAGFNFLLAICLSCFTHASRAEVFTVMAGFGAITVVFVASNPNCAASRLA